MPKEIFDTRPTLVLSHQINNLFFILFVWGFNQCWSVLGFFSRFSSGFKNWTPWVEAGQDVDTLDAHKLGLVKARVW
jgi:hypothetical protein